MRLAKGQAGQKSTFRLWKTTKNGGIKQFQGYGNSKFIIDWANHLSSIENLGLHEPSSRGQKMFHNNNLFSTHLPRFQLNGRHDF